MWSKPVWMKALLAKIFDSLKPGMMKPDIAAGLSGEFGLILPTILNKYSLLV
jgi:hypothetical protein